MKRLATPSRSFLCLRHGVTDWNAQGRFQGRTDNPLNDEGISQAQAAADRLCKLSFDHVVASPLARARQTAEIIAVAARKPLDIDDGMIECDFGSLEGTSIADTMKAHGLRTVEDLVSILPPGWRAVAVDFCTSARLRQPMARPSSTSRDPVRLPRCRDAVDIGSAVRALDRQPSWNAVQV
jgi:hypothetical protein